MEKQKERDKKKQRGRGRGWTKGKGRGRGEEKAGKKGRRREKKERREEKKVVQIDFHYWQPKGKITAPHYSLPRCKGHFQHSLIKPIHKYYDSWEKRSVEREKYSEF